MTESEVREILLDGLPKSTSKKRIDELVNRLATDDQVGSVEVCDTRAPIETVEAYGLELEIDANGRAVIVHFPNNAYVA